MGNTPSDTTGVIDDEFPWFHMLQWAGQVVPSGKVVRYDIDAVRITTQKLCSNEIELFEQISTEDISDLQLPTFLDEFPLTDETYSDTTVDMGNPTMLEFATFFINQMPILSQVRYRMVPRIISEDVFWHKFFSLILRHIIQTLAS